MTQQLHLLGEYYLQQQLAHAPMPNVRTRYDVKVGERLITVDVVFGKKLKKLTAYALTDVSPELFESLKSESNIEDWTPSVSEEWIGLNAVFREAATRLLRILKFLMREHSLSEDFEKEFPIGHSFDNCAWGGPVGASFQLHGLTFASFAPFTDDAAAMVARFAEQEEPYFYDAFRHLHRAFGAAPRFAWVDATIAAELAIKEFLCRKVPTLKPLLVECPSPPLGKLYGRLLKEYAGEESPKRKVIEEGAAKRNKLVHQYDVSVTKDEAATYVEDVEVAIFHLLTLLYPDLKFLDRQRRSADSVSRNGTITVIRE